MEYDNTNTGAIFINNKKTTDKHPDRSGSLNVEGKDYWIKGWINTNKDGEPYLKVSVSPKEQDAPAKPQARKAIPMDDDGSIPF